MYGKGAPGQFRGNGNALKSIVIVVVGTGLHACAELIGGICKMSVFCCLELISPVSCFKKKIGRGEGERSLRAPEEGLPKQEKRVFLFCGEGWEGDNRAGIRRCLPVGTGFVWAGPSSVRERKALRWVFKPCISCVMQIMIVFQKEHQTGPRGLLSYLDSIFSTCG